MALAMRNCATLTGPSCSPSYTNSIFPLIAEIAPNRSLILAMVFVSPLINTRRSALLTMFSKAEILKRAETPLFASTNSEVLASKLICSIKSRKSSGTTTMSSCACGKCASCCVIFFAISMLLG